VAGGLKPWELVSARASILEVLDETCDIRRSERARDDYGGYTSEAALVAEDVPCRVHVPERDPDQPIGIEGAPLRLLVTVPHGTDVREGDRLTIADYDDVVVLREREPETWALFVALDCASAGLGEQ
jgi:hypothetical protein